jgi:predicted ATPase
MPDAPISIFISYAHADSAFVDRLEADLRHQGFDPWVDRQRLAGGLRWRRELQEAVEQAQVLLIVLSPDAIASQSVQIEFDYALDLHKVVIPLYHRQCEVPMELRAIQWVDFRQSYEQGLSALLDTLHRHQQRAVTSNSTGQSSPSDLGDQRPQPAQHEQAQAGPAPFNNLPAQLTPLIGREQESQAACALVRQAGVRLITLTGTGGIGKTRLALHIAGELLADFADGIALVALAPITDPDLVVPAIAHTFSLREAADHSLPEQLKAFLHEKHLLLVLDNFEQVVAAAPLLSELLEACSHLKLLVTSRAVLNVRGEHVFPVPPLTVPNLAQLPDLEDISQAPAVALFLERASAVKPQFELTQANAASIAELCVRLDGLPLAIELAAARIKMFPPEALLARLTQGLQFLSGGARDLPARQQTLSNTIKWSYDLLEQEAQTVFRSLSVFEGGCTLEAAEAVCQGAGAASLDVVNALTTLLDNSLLQQSEQQAAEPRFLMLETVREFGLERLRAAGEEEQTRRLHAQYYAQQAEAAVSPFGPVRGTLAMENAQEFPNARAALRWAAERREITLGLQLATYLGYLWFLHGQMREANAWLEEMLALDANAGEQGAPLSWRIAALNVTALIAISQGHAERVTALAQEVLQLAKRSADPAGISVALGFLGRVAQARGESEQAAAYFEEGYSQARRLGASDELYPALINLAEIARLQGDLVRSKALLEEALSAARTRGFTFWIADMLTLLGHLAREQQDYPQARERYRESLGLYRTLGNSTFLAWCLEGIAALLYAEHRYEPTIRLCAAATTLRLRAQSPMPPAEQEHFDQIVKAARAELDEATFDEAWASGLALSQDEAITYALSSIGT